MNYRSLFLLIIGSSSMLSSMDHQKNDTIKKSLIEYTQLVTQATTYVDQLKHTANWRVLTQLTKSVDDACDTLHRTQGIEAHPNELTEFIAAKKKFDKSVLLKSDGAYSALRLRIEKKEFSEIANIAFQTTFACDYVADYTENLKIKEALLRKAWMALDLYSGALHVQKNKFNSLNSKTSNDFALLSHVTEQLIKNDFPKFDWPGQHLLENNNLNITYYSPEHKKANAKNASHESRMAKFVRKLTQPKIKTLESKQENNNHNDLKKSLSMDEINKLVKK